MSIFSKHHQAGLHGRAYTGTNFVDREQYRAGRNSRFDLSGGGGAGASGGAGIALIALPLLAIALALAPLAGILAAVGTPILVSLAGRRGEDRNAGALFLPAAVASFIVVVLFMGNWYLMSDSGDARASVLASAVVAAILGPLAGGFALHRMIFDSYRRSVADTAMAIVAPAALCLVLLVIGYTFGTPLEEFPLLFWLVWAGIAGVLIGVQAGIVFAGAAWVISRRPFIFTAVMATLGVFVSVLATACVYYFFQLGGFFLDMIGGRTGPALGPTMRGLWGALPGYVLLNVPGMLLCWSALGMVRPPFALWSRILSCLLLAVVNNFIFLNASRILY